MSGSPEGLPLGPGPGGPRVHDHAAECLGASGAPDDPDGDPLGGFAVQLAARRSECAARGLLLGWGFDGATVELGLDLFRAGPGRAALGFYADVGPCKGRRQ